MKMIFGGIYERKNAHYDYLNDQRYNYYIPVALKDKESGKIQYKMVDTYMINRPNIDGKDMEQRLWYLEQANCGETSWRIFYGHQDYFYQNIVRLSSDELDENDWKLIADLHDYELISDDASRDYLEQDLLEYLPLWNEDCYRWNSGGVGRIYKRKGAKKDGWRVYSHASYKYDFKMASDWVLNELETVCKDVLQNMTLARGKKKIIKNEIKKIRKYRSLSKEYREYCNNLK